MKKSTRDGYKAMPMTVLTHIPFVLGPVTDVLLRLFRRTTSMDDVRGLKFIHFAEWQLLRVPFTIHLLNKSWRYQRYYLLFNTNYNGPWKNYIVSFTRVPNIRIGMDYIWGSGSKYPRAKNESAFTAYVEKNELETDYYYSRYGHASIRDIDNALAVCSALDKVDRSLLPSNDEDFSFTFQNFVADHASSLCAIERAETSQPVTVNFKRTTPRMYTLSAALNCVSCSEHSRATRELIDTMSSRLDALFRVPMVHFSRFSVLDELGHRDGMRANREIQYPMLIWTFVIDCSADTFFAALLERDAGCLAELFNQCHGAPYRSSKNSALLRDFLTKSIRPPGVQYYSGEQSALEICNALDQLVQVSALAAQLPDLSAQQLEDQYRAIRK